MDLNFFCDEEAPCADFSLLLAPANSSWRQRVHYTNSQKKQQRWLLQTTSWNTKKWRCSCGPKLLI